MSLRRIISLFVILGTTSLVALTRISLAQSGVTSILSLMVAECRMGEFLYSSTRSASLATPKLHDEKCDGKTKVSVQTRTIDARKKTITGIVVAYDNGVGQGDGSCRQTLIVRTDKAREHDASGQYIIVRHASSCLELIPEKTLEIVRQRRFPVKRDETCDQSFDEVQYFVTLSPTGAVSRTPRLKPVPGREKEKIPTECKLSCYSLTSSFDVGVF